MGFLDKAKRAAEQAQAKLDEVQQQFNESRQRSGQGGADSAVRYDQHGRPIPPSESATPPHGDPVAPHHPGTASPGPSAHAEDPAPPHGDPVAPDAPLAPQASETPGVPRTEAPAEEDRNHPSSAPPPLSSGDPLAG